MYNSWVNESLISYVVHLTALLYPGQTLLVPNPAGDSSKEGEVAVQVCSIVWFSVNFKLVVFTAIQEKSRKKSENLETKNIWIFSHSPP